MHIKNGERGKKKQTCAIAHEILSKKSQYNFSGHGLMGLLLPLSSGMSGKRKDCWVLGKHEYMDGEQAKSYKKWSLPFQ